MAELFRIIDVSWIVSTKVAWRSFRHKTRDPRDSQQKKANTKSKVYISIGITRQGTHKR